MMEKIGLAALISGGVLVGGKIPHRMTVWLRDVPIVGTFIEKISLPIGVALLVLGIFLVVMANP